MTDKPHFERVALIGVGLIGSSLARLLQRDKLADHIVACARTAGTRAKVLELGIVDSVTADPAEAARGADLVVLCTPIGAFVDIANAIASALRADAIVTDVGSVKSTVLRDLTAALPKGTHIVPAHPVAGTEYSGPESGFAKLFEGRWCILTPPSDADLAVVEIVASLWRTAGSRIEIMDEHRAHLLPDDSSSL